MVSETVCKRPAVVDVAASLSGWLQIYLSQCASPVEHESLRDRWPTTSRYPQNSGSDRFRCRARLLLSMPLQTLSNNEKGIDHESARRAVRKGLHRGLRLDAGVPPGRARVVLSGRCRSARTL